MHLDRHIPNWKPDEKLILFVRRHWIVIIFEHLMFIAIGIIPVIIYYFLEGAYPLAIDPNGPFYAPIVLVATIFYLFIWMFLYNTYLDYYLDVWIVTNKRIINIEQKGLFNRVISEQTLDKVQDVTSIMKGFFPTFFTYGDVYIQTAAAKERFIFKQVDNPQIIAKKINELLPEYIKELEEEKKSS